MGEHLAHRRRAGPGDPLPKITGHLLTDEQMDVVEEAATKGLELDIVLEAVRVALNNPAEAERRRQAILAFAEDHRQR